MRTQEEWSNEEDARAYREIRALVDGWKSLGYKTYPDGTEWVGHTPHRAPEAYLHQLYAPLGATGIEQMETELSDRLPDNFRCFLMLHNGIGLFANYLNIYGLRRSWSRTNLVEAGQQPFSILVPNVQRRPISAPDDVIFIGSLGDNRNLIGMNPDGSVFRWESDVKSYSSVFAFLLEEANEEAALFNPDGRRRESGN
ncbi:MULTISPECIES: SMI1/KNR4 family protein [unclassified Mesorhizobium]|uniref:SMI1/KNR4 family protein n=1 Tax=unclassified Mesorhizobium TaxID=325217 RepID=UPI0013E38A6A|nr:MULTISPECIES: SMI1/KNR4 family protein [unclassified Mesorhizobium]